MRATTFFTSVLVATIGFAATAHAVLIHDYDLNGTLNDALGGPSLVANGGVLGASSYSFGVNQGLTLSNALPNVGNYSILIDFSLTDLSGYRRILDFKNRTSDTGLYDLNTALNFFNVFNSAVGVFTVNTEERLIVTRDSVTGAFAGYVNGSGVMSFTDSGSLATFSQVGAIMNFFIDDLAVGGEASAGVVDKISIYDSTLSSTQVSQLGGPGVGGPIPEPGTVVFGFFSITAALVGRRRRKCAQA